jgi:flagellin-like protein
MKGLSPLVSVAMLILIAFFVAVIINSWTQGTVVEILKESYDNYRKVVDNIAGSIFNLFR